MSRFLILSSLFVVSLYSQTLNELITHSLTNHNSLKAIEHKLSSVDDALEISRNFANPEVVLSVSDIQFDDPTNRSLEPMQYQSISFKQKIPYFGKRDANSEYIKRQKSVVFASLELAQIALSREISLSAYTIWETQEKIQVLDEFIALNKKNVDLSNAYSESGSSSHIESMNIQLALSELKIKKSTLESKLNGLYKRISYLSSMEVNAISVDVSVYEPKSFEKYLADLQNNKSYKTKTAELKVKESLVKVKELESNIDPFVKVGYFNRVEYEDYLSVSVGASLPIYGTESLKEQQSRKEVLESTLLRADFYENLKSKLGENYSKLQSQYTIYKIITKESLAEIEHMTELTASMLKNGRNLFLYTQILEKKLTLTEQKISAMAAFKRSEVEILALVGVTK